MKNVIVSLIFSLYLLFSCRTVEVPYPVEVPVRYDSIVTVIERDTVLSYPKQEQKVVTADSSFLKTDLAFSYAKIDSAGKLHHSIENFGNIPSKIKETKKEVNKDVPVIVKTPAPNPTIIYKWNWLSWFGLISALYWLTRLVLYFKKLFKI